MKKSTISSQSQQSLNNQYHNQKIRKNEQQHQGNIGTKLKHNLPKKIIANNIALDDIGTKKLKQIDSFTNLCDRILSQTQKLNKLVPQEDKSSLEISQKSDIKQPQQTSAKINLTYDPHYHTGLIQNYIAVTSQQEKRLFGLSNQGKCQYFTLNNKFLVVIVGRLPADYANGMKVGLYIPRQIVQTLPQQDQSSQNQNSQKHLIIIQRRSPDPSTSLDPNFLNSPLIILQPQILLYPSYLCSWIQCKRRISLVNYISSQFQVNQHLVFGSACHRYMQWLLDQQVKLCLQSYQQWKQQVIRKVYQSFLYDMYLVGATFQRFFQYCQVGLTNIRQWVKMFIMNKKQLQVNKYQRLYLKIQKVVGSETMHRSGYFGLKGKTDGLFKGKLINKKTNTVQQVFIPFELKTGKKPSQSHKRQTDIYNMLLRERQKQPVIGLLYYSQSNITIFRQQNKQMAFETIVIHRNTIVMNLKKLYQGQQIKLPQLTHNSDNCKLCQMAIVCEIIQQSQRNEIKKQKQRILRQKLNKKRANNNNNHNANQFHKQQSNNDQIKLISSQQQQKAKLMSSLFDSQSQEQQLEQQLKQLQQQDSNLLPLPSTHNPKAKLTLQQLTYPQRAYLTNWLQLLHLQQLQLKQQLQKNVNQGYGNFILTYQQLQKINAYFHSTKLQTKLTFSIQKKYKSLQQLHKLLSVYTVSLKLRILIQHLGIMQGCKIISIRKQQQNKLTIQLQMNSLEVVMNRRALTYSIQHKVQHDVELEKFQNLQVAGWRYVVYKFILSSNQKLKSLVIDQYINKHLTNINDTQQIQQNKSMPNNNNISQLQLSNSNLIQTIKTPYNNNLTKQSQSTVDVTNRDDGSKNKIININQNLILIADDQQQLQLFQLQPLVKNTHSQLQQHQLNLNISLQSNNQLNVSKNQQFTTIQLTQNLNTHQLAAFNRVFSPQTYCTLVQGMPGTGKTQLIVKIIQQAYLLNQNVLITTYTNRSLDNILQRIFNQHQTLSIPQQHIIRQGSRYSIDPKFQTLNHRHYQFKTVQQYKQYFISKKLWFVTLSSINIHHIPKHFDLIILDEASQSLQPVCLQALNRGKNIVMIGDYKQLQPIVKSKKAGQKGMNVSLFQRLCIKYPELTVALRLQYRMNNQIMRLSNKLVYQGELQMGSDKVANKKLQLPIEWQTHIRQQTLQQIICPANPVVLLNHDGITNSLSSRHREKYNQMSHVLQVQCGVFIYQALTGMGIRQQDISIVCCYNRTVDVVNSMISEKRRKNRIIQIDDMQQNKDSVNISSNKQSQVQSLTVPALTIDKSQGIDKQVIILLIESVNSPLTQSKYNNTSLLESSRRLNVALTRAKSKLILIGSMRHLKQLQVWQGQLAMMLQQKMYNMTKGLIDYVLGKVSSSQIEMLNGNKNKERLYLQQNYQQMQKQHI